MNAPTFKQQLSYKQKSHQSFFGHLMRFLYYTIFSNWERRLAVIFHFQFLIFNYLPFPISSYLSRNETLLSPCLYEIIVSRLTFSTLWKMLLSIWGLIFFRFAISCLISCRFEPVLLFGEQVVQVSVKRHAH